MTGSDLARKPWLTRDALRRVLLSLIVAEQGPRLASGAIGPESSVRGIVRGMAPDQQESLTLDDETCGFDSLATLDLILRVNRFFGLHQSGVEDYLLVNRCIGDWLDLIAEHRRLVSGDVVLTFATSGSSGPPKNVSFEVATLAAEIDSLRHGPLADFKPGGRIIALVPPHHIYGFLFTCLLPSILDGEVFDMHATVPTSAFSAAEPGDMVIATPHIWKILARSGLQWRENITGVTSAGPSDTETWTICESAGLRRLIEIYGATETGGVGVRMSQDAPFTLLSHLDRDREQIMRGGTCLDIQDHLIWSAERDFAVVGRLDDVVQIGGVNVSPKHVACVMSDIPGVGDVAVRLMDGQLHASIVLAESALDPTVFEADVRREIKVRLDPAARPAGLSFGMELPRNPMGKLINWA